ncbi:MAG TPA: endolytic transglycosylase MltG [Pseudomonadales bacterium]|nr:endolytic transglycosylase MltG [Pseudomonadales bacterium]
MTRIKKRILVGIFTVLLITGASTWWAYRSLHEPTIFNPSPIEFDIKQGRSLYGVTKILRKQGVLSPLDALNLSFYGYLTRQSHLVKKGEYRLISGQTPLDMLELFVKGKVIQHPFTIVEGWTVRDLLAALAKEPKLKHTLGDVSDDKLLETLGLQPGSAEGLFFADTYHFVRFDSDISILKRAYERMDDVLKKEWVLRASALPYGQPFDALIMASIIEKETGVPEERPEIAGVFVRRLQKNMLLQTDPSVIYGVRDIYNGNLTREHLQLDTPYNTYLHVGLPPTPIALPGKGALHAALHPNEGEALYFVAKGDGRHCFSSTLEEHTVAVKKYQLQKNENYRSSPGTGR